MTWKDETRRQRLMMMILRALRCDDSWSWMHKIPVSEEWIRHKVSVFDCRCVGVRSQGKEFLYWYSQWVFEAVDSISLQLLFTVRLGFA